MGVAEISLLAFADAGERFGFRRPVINDEPILKIKEGWHPLHTMCLDPGQYIPSHTMLSGGAGSDHSTMVSYRFSQTAHSRWLSPARMALASRLTESRCVKRYSCSLTSGRIDHLHGAHRLLCPGRGR